MAKAQLKVTNKCTSDLGTIVMHTVELLDADGVMKEYGIKDYHDDNGIFDTEIEDISTGEDIYIDSTLGKRIIDALDEYDNDNDNTSSTGDSVKDVINEYIANQQSKLIYNDDGTVDYDEYADDPNLEVQMNQDEISVSEKVNYFLAELGINDDEFEDHIHTLITHHKHVQSDKRDSMTYEDAHVNHDIVVPCSAKLDNEMYNESI
tara:strand:- start:752 stop:1369 length:618 start_codon:yes stop_codon:yes gene_type:complete